ncbi:MAG TPA: putative solute-binding protein, partial [Pseudomonadales bacterium]|nr:putative solute-binding protein [Pseudomonadales bacterium]
MRGIKRRVLALCAALGVTAFSAAALAIEPGQQGMPEAFSKPLKLRFCVFDPLGTYGDAYSNARDMALEAKKWNMEIELKLYPDERVASEDFKAGQCEGVALSTLRAKQFNKFMGSIDSIGSIPSYDHMRSVLQTLANQKVIPLTISGPYQIIATIPLGAAYIFVNDRSINSVEKAAGKKVAVLEWDTSQQQLVHQMGATPINSDITNFANKFNNGQVDIIAAPAIAFKPLEIYKGLGTKGGVFRFPVAMITGSVVINREKLIKEIPDLDQRMLGLRDFAFTQLDRVFAIIDKAEKDIDEKYWMDL